LLLSLAALMLLIPRGPSRGSFKTTLATASSPRATTELNYDLLGNLCAVTLPSGAKIRYVVDGQGRRVGKKVDGKLVQGFLYGAGQDLLAELDDRCEIVSRFVYASGRHVPEGMTRGNRTYRFICDELGSLRLVVDVHTGVVAQRIDYDEFGIVLNDTQPGFQPFGFAGGLYDRDTKLTRFGARDYDAQTGRWTARDPVYFQPGQANLYAYTHNDPVNLTDPSGLDPQPSQRDQFQMIQDLIDGKYDPNKRPVPSPTPTPARTPSFPRPPSPGSGRPRGGSGKPCTKPDPLQGPDRLDIDLNEESTATALRG